MKIAFLPLLFLFLFASSCSKDPKINRRLDGGTWNLKSTDGQTLPTSNVETRTYTFKKSERKAGTVSIDTKTPFGSEYRFTGSYVLSDDGDLLITATDQNGVPLSLHFQVDEITKDEIKWTVVDSDVKEVLEK